MVLRNLVTVIGLYHVFLYPDGAYRFCTYLRRVNSVTKTNSYPIPQMDDCMDKIGKAKYITNVIC
jgi:hypothetical protein